MMLKSKSLEKSKILEKFPVIKVLLKQCFCSACMGTKNNIKYQVGDVTYLKICKVLNII